MSSYMFRLSGIIHVLFEALEVFIEGTPDDEVPAAPSATISHDEFQMAIVLTEYFQSQRQAYDKVQIDRGVGIVYI